MENRTVATSDSELIPYILKNIGQVRFKSVLDIGVGFGKYGALIREYFDLRSAANPREMQRDRWRLRIEGIEAFGDFITERQHANYDRIHVGDARQVLPTLGNYDVILLIATLIHMSREDGLQLVRMMYEHCNKFVLFTAPTRLVPQGDSFGNPFEVHHDVIWTPRDFAGFPHVIHGRTHSKKTRLFILQKCPGRMRFIDPLSPEPFTSRVRPLVKSIFGERVARSIGAIIHRRPGGRA